MKMELRVNASFRGVREFFMIFSIIVFTFITAPYTAGLAMAQTSQSQEQLALLTQGCCNSPQNLTEAIALLRNFSSQYPELAAIADGLENASSLDDLTSVTELMGNFTEKYAPEASAQVQSMRELASIVNVTSSINISEPGGLEALSNVVNNNLTKIIDTIAPPPITTLAIREKASQSDLTIAPGQTKTITYEIEVINGLHPLENAIAAELLYPGTAFITASQPYIADDNPNGTTIIFSIGSLAPKETRTFTVTVNITGTSGFQQLSKGAIAKGWDTIGSKVISSGPDPLMLAPSSLQKYLTPTLDAQSNHPDISNLAAGMSDDPHAIFAYVRDKIEYDPYYGSMRGALGTYWGGSGSSEDQANLLVALLRAAHIPARYVIGEIDNETALKIINGMFDYPSVVLGYVPEEQRYNPANDFELINTVKKHAWVEMYDGSDWIPLDPTVPDAEYGVLPYMPVSINGTYSELPDSLRYKITLKLQVERDNLFGFGSSFEHPLNYTAYVSELTDTPISFSEFAIRTTVFFFGTEQFEPSLTVGNETVNASYQFDTLLEGLVSKRLIFEVAKPDGTIETYEHPLLNTNPNYEIISSGWGMTVGMAFTEFSQMYIAGYEHADIQNIREFPETISSLSQLVTSNNSDELLNSTGYIFHNILKQFFTVSDKYSKEAAEKLLLKNYLDSPRIAAASLDFRTPEIGLFINLVNGQNEAIPLEGQNPVIIKSYQYFKGILDTVIEDSVFPASVSTPDVFVETEPQQKSILTITKDNLKNLALTNHPDSVKRRMVDAIYLGKTIIVPDSQIEINGTNYSNWYEIDTETGKVVDFSKEGMHFAAIEKGVFNALGSGFAGQFVNLILHVIIKLAIFLTIFTLIVVSQLPKICKYTVKEIFSESGNIRDLISRIICESTHVAIIYPFREFALLLLDPKVELNSQLGYVLLKRGEFNQIGDIVMQKDNGEYIVRAFVENSQWKVEYRIR